MKKRETNKYVVKTVKGFKLQYPTKIYISISSKEDIILTKINSGEIKSPYQFLVNLVEVNQSSYALFPTTEQEDYADCGFEDDCSHRRSLTDLLGIYLTYFPTRNTKPGIWRFIKDFVRFGNEYNIIGHYCTDPEKIVFYKPESNYLEMRCKYRNIPLSRLGHELYYGEEDEEDSDLIYIEECSDFVDRCDYSYMAVPDDEDSQDLITPGDMEKMLRLAYNESK